MFILLILSACTRAHLSSTNPGNLAPREIGKSFAVTPTLAPGSGTDQARVSIAKVAFEKEFLMHASLIQQEVAPEFHALRSRVVFFRRTGDKVIMIEASRGQLLTKDYPQTLPLAEFPITAETKDNVTFDFNAGMGHVLYGTDFQAHSANAGPGNYVSFKTSLSYLSRAAVVGEELLEIHQTAVAEFPVGSLKVTTPIEIVYYLSPYKTNPNFKPTVAPLNLDHFGFIEASTQFNDSSGRVTYAAKHDITKPITYTISANTPVKYQGAIRDGVLYWNKAFGREVMVVKVGQDPSETPNPLNNVIRWVDYESARKAYADVQIDPRTGEILHHQINIPSMWARVGRQGLRGRVPLPATDHLRKAMGVIELCALERSADAAADPRVQTDKAVQDTLRDVVAHEVGHTLGLLHNFAGSLAASYDVDARADVIQKYLDTGRTPDDLVVTSSVMEYSRPVESMLFGDQIARSKKAAAYDEKAIRTLYFGETFGAGDLPLFCGDANYEQYADCAPFDVGNAFLGWIKLHGRRALEKVPRGVIEDLIEAKVPAFGEPAPGLDGYQPNLKRVANRMFGPHLDLVKLLRGETRLLSVERQFPNHGSAFAPEILKRTHEVIAADLARAGGFEKTLVRANFKLAQAMTNELDRLLQTPEILRGHTVDGRPYELTTDDVIRAKEIGRKVFGALTLEMAQAEVKALAGQSGEDDASAEERLLEMLKGPPRRFALTPVTREFAIYLARRAANLMFATTGEPLEFRRQAAWTSAAGNVDGAMGEELNLKLPRFAYPLELRLRSAELLRPDRGESPAWGHTERRVLGALFGKMFGEAAPGVELGSPDVVDGWPLEAQRWILEARELAMSLEMILNRPARGGVKPAGATP